MVELIPMTESEYQTYIEQIIHDYAQEHVQAGRWSQAEALQKAKQEFQQYLPQGLQSLDNYLYTIVEKQLKKPVGVFWFALHTQPGQQRIFVYDVVIFEEFRHHGYATQSFQLLEERARELGATAIGLHVFGHNVIAREMYKKLGYVETNIHMVKKLGTER